MSTCLHRHKRVLIDLAVSADKPTYQIMCADCLVRTSQMLSGMEAWLAWLRDRACEPRAA